MNSIVTMRSSSSQPPAMNPNATTIINPNGDGGFESRNYFWQQITGLSLMLEIILVMNGK